MEYTLLDPIANPQITWKTHPQRPPILRKKFSSGNYLDEIQNTEFKKKIINMIKELKKFKEDTSKHLNEWKWVFKNRSRNKLLTEVLEHTNEWLDEIAKTMQDLKTEISKKIEILKKRSWSGIRNEKFKDSVRKLKESLTSEIDQVEDRTLGLKDNIEQLGQSMKGYDECVKTRKRDM